MGRSWFKAARKRDDAYTTYMYLLNQGQEINHKWKRKMKTLNRYKRFHTKQRDWWKKMIEFYIEKRPKGWYKLQWDAQRQWGWHDDRLTYIHQLEDEI